jgi:O-methyltransferase
MAFYGLPRADLEKVYDAIIEVGTLYRDNDRFFYASDNMIALMRCASFAKEERFRTAFLGNDTNGDEDHKMWRLHTYCWAARSALSLPGDFVECGVYKGFYAAVLTQYLDFEGIEKDFYLYDTFAGLPAEWSTPEERNIVEAGYDWDGTYQAVIDRFAKYRNVHVVKGVVPDVLAEKAPERIAFLHLDMNAAAAETAALDHLFERICDGGMVLMDDYGREENENLHNALQNWWRARGHTVLELPTGQGLAIKRG